ncbi:hypothetical protein BSZ37_20295 [Rubrivirga marina]|uniref:Uncharacterized protein n=1 Tax=Rubrivirga marina TaxID=1196024 RepID=A0A271ITX4_9BACT|nr:hypothetical protein BSZ37_20295 [Rubrivirga marina]
MLLAAALLGGTAAAQGGHGPVFGLATPTLPEGAWNGDATLMSAGRGGERGLMARQTLRYGLTEDVQLNLSVPQTLAALPSPSRTRIGTMMGGMGDLEALALWRLQKHYPGGGRRVESTALASVLVPVVAERGGVRAAPGANAAVVTGYASRSLYGWVGAGAQGHLARDGDRLGPLGYASAVVGYRPPVFQGDYPKPDLRVFVEAVAEVAGRDRVAGEAVAASGGERVLVGPTALGLYRAWGLGAGVLFPVYDRSNGPQPREDARLAVNLSYWF